MTTAGIAPRITVDIISSQLIPILVNIGLVDISALKLLFTRVGLFGSSGFTSLISFILVRRSKKGISIRVTPRVNASTRLRRVLFMACHPNIIYFLSP